MNKFTVSLNGIEGYGGVVGLSVLLRVRSGPDGLRLTWKQKSGNKTAAVNAFHMHRGLCRELEAIIASNSLIMTSRETRACKLMLSQLVSSAYWVRQDSERQWFDATIYINRTNPYYASTLAISDKDPNSQEFVSIRGKDGQELEINLEEGGFFAQSRGKTDSAKLADPRALAWELVPFAFVLDPVVKSSLL